MKRLILGAAMLAIFAVSLSLTSHGATAQVPPTSTPMSTSTPSPTATRTPTATPTPSPTAVPATAAAATTEPAEAPRPAVFACYAVELDDAAPLGDEEDTALDEEDADADEETVEDDGRLRIDAERAGFEIVSLGDLELICVSSLKIEDSDSEEAPAAEETRVFACYAIEDGNDARDSFSFMTEAYGPDAVIIRDSELVCEEAAMTLEDDTTVGEASGAAWLCRGLRRGDNPNTDVVYVNLFGSDEADVGRALSLCEVATFRNAPGEEEPDEDPEVAPEETTEAEAEDADAEVADATEAPDLLACYDLNKGKDPEVMVTIETLSFGRLDVFVRDAVMLCEPAFDTPGDLLSDDDDDEPRRPIVSISPGERTTGAAAAGTDDDDGDLDSAIEAEIDRLIDLLRDGSHDELVDGLIDFLDRNGLNDADDGS